MAQQQVIAQAHNNQKMNMINNDSNDIIDNIKLEAKNIMAVVFLCVILNIDPVDNLFKSVSINLNPKGIYFFQPSLLILYGGALGHVLPSFVALLAVILRIFLWTLFPIVLTMKVVHPLSFELVTVIYPELMTPWVCIHILILSCLTSFAEFFHLSLFQLACFPIIISRWFLTTFWVQNREFI